MPARVPNCCGPWALPQAVSEDVYRILLRYSSCVQPLSCDEAYLDVTGLGDPEALAARIRAEVAAATGCTASAGGGNGCWFRVEGAPQWVLVQG